MKSLADIVHSREELERFRPPWDAFLGNIPKGYAFSALLHGMPNSGKSSFALLLACELARLGPVFYALAEERIKAGTIRQRAQDLGINHHNVFFEEITSLDHLHELFPKYKAVIVDSINRIPDGRGKLVDPEEVLHLRLEHPQTIPIFVSQDTKDGQYRGGAGIKHDVDISWVCVGEQDQPRICYTEKTRFGPSINCFRLPHRRKKRAGKRNIEIIEESRRGAAK